MFPWTGGSDLFSAYGGDDVSFFKSLGFSDPFDFLSIASFSVTSADVSSLTGAGVGVGVEFGVDSLDAGPSERLSSVPFNLSRLSASYCLSTILLNVSSSTAGLQCFFNSS